MRRPIVYIALGMLLTCMIMGVTIGFARLVFAGDSIRKVSNSDIDIALSALQSERVSPEDVQVQGSNTVAGESTDGATASIRANPVSPDSSNDSSEAPTPVTRATLQPPEVSRGTGLPANGDAQRALDRRDQSYRAQLLRAYGEVVTAQPDTRSPITQATPTPRPPGATDIPRPRPTRVPPTRTRVPRPEPTTQPPPPANTPVPQPEPTTQPPPPANTPVPQPEPPKQPPPPTNTPVPQPEPPKDDDRDGDGDDREGDDRGGDDGDRDGDDRSGDDGDRDGDGRGGDSGGGGGGDGNEGGDRGGKDGRDRKP
jgi:hypothetical protein